MGPKPHFGGGEVFGGGYSGDQAGSGPPKPFESSLIHK
ncbi:hypothetical protein CCACVL1_19985 [Corchorus capsularis]|uniref:Uncharacterized protein n=1 Tax=Corchorus capsularis TaxID=210143 RepID=A0A1R3HDG7_COCAP|nr:hypothetical protein CCACVL1_19985 [Corchorus capsularis]